MIPSESISAMLAGICQLHPIFRLVLLYHQNVRGEPLSFSDFGAPFLIPLYAEFADMEGDDAGADIMAAVQCGKSELFIILMFYWAGWKGRIAAYMMPKFAIRNRFVQNRINRLLAGIPEYKNRRDLKSVDNLVLKRFGPGTLMFLGSNTAADVVELSADEGIIDEYDLCDPVNASKLIDRLMASPYPALFRVGNPTIPNKKIHRLYLQGDQRRWHHVCSHCGEAQPLDWFVNVVEQAPGGQWVARDVERREGSLPVRPVCRSCSEPFERNGKGSAWIPVNPGVARRSYHMSRLDMSTALLRRLIEVWIKAQGDLNAIQRFFASILGMPHSGTGARISDAMLQAVAIEDPLDYHGGASYADQIVVMGVDVGSILHLTVSIAEYVEEDKPEAGAEPEEHKPDAPPEWWGDDSDDDDLDYEPPEEEPTINRRGRFAAAVRTFEEVEDAIERYRVDCVVIDAGPEKHAVEALQERIDKRTADPRDPVSCRVWRCYFRGGGKHKITDRKYGISLDYATKTVTVDRLGIMDASYSAVSSGRRTLPSDIFTVLHFAQQMGEPVRVLDDERRVIKWSKGNGQDHFRLADTYEELASLLLGVDFGGYLEIEIG